MSLIDFGFGVTQSFGDDAPNTKTQTGGSAPTAQGTQFQAPEPLKVDQFSRPGDSFGDSQMREQQYSGLLKQAGTGSGMTRRQSNESVANDVGMKKPFQQSSGKGFF